MTSQSWIGCRDETCASDVGSQEMMIHREHSERFLFETVIITTGDTVVTLYQGHLFFLKKKSVLIREVSFWCELALHAFMVLAAKSLVSVQDRCPLEPMSFKSETIVCLNLHDRFVACIAQANYKLFI